MTGTGVMHISQTWRDNQNRVAFEQMKADVDRRAGCWQRYACYKDTWGSFKIHFPSRYRPSSVLFSSLREQSHCFCYQGPHRVPVFLGWCGMKRGPCFSVASKKSLGLLANTGSCPWVCVVAQRLWPLSKLHPLQRERRVPNRQTCTEKSHFKHIQLL